MEEKEEWYFSVVDTTNLLRLIQSIPSPKAEPFKMWLAETSTTDISKEEHSQGLSENIKVAKRGGNVAGNARKESVKNREKLVGPNIHCSPDLTRTLSNFGKRSVLFIGHSYLYNYG